MNDVSGIMLADIPRAFTALAEWLACVVYITQRPKRRTGGKWWLAALGVLAVQTLFLVLTDDVPLYLWVPCMLAAVVLMLVFIYASSDVNWMTAGYCCCRAFLLAEFAASLEWQLYYYAAAQLKADPPLLRLVFLLAVYGAVFGFVLFMERRWLPHDQYCVTSARELAAPIVIGIAAFSISNLSFTYADTPFSSTILTDIFNTRTLVDLGGLAILYAYHLQRSDLRARYELETINTLLASQYAQYQQSRESIDLINRKYHDLKHQIAVLRREPDSAVRSAYLDQMEADIRSYEAQNKTGNAVLDTVLTGKALICQKHGITLTTVADGKLLAFMNAMDICTIFGNALDNAIEYEKELPDPEKRMIRLSVSRQKGFVMIFIGNYFEGSLNYEDGIPQTTKGDRAFHGYGVKSIRQTAQKYGGSLSVSSDNQSFNIRVLLPLPKEITTA